MSAHFDVEVILKELKDVKSMAALLHNPGAAYPY
jgi:hypothetical protein